MLKWEHKTPYLYLKLWEQLNQTIQQDGNHDIPERHLFPIRLQHPVKTQQVFISAQIAMSQPIYLLVR